MYLQVQLCPDTGETPVADVTHTCLGLVFELEGTTHQELHWG